LHSCANNIISHYIISAMIQSDPIDEEYIIETCKIILLAQLFNRRRLHSCSNNIISHYIISAMIQSDPIDEEY
jgi:transcriptional regulator of NAD metabolism